MPTLEELAAQGDSGTLRLEEQAKKITVMGSRTPRGHREPRRAMSRRIELAADGALSVPVPGALAGT